MFNAKCESIGTSEDGFCYVRVYADNLEPGTAYHIFIPKLTDITSGEYKYSTTAKFDTYSFVTEGETPADSGYAEMYEETGPVYCTYYQNGTMTVNVKGDTVINAAMTDYTESNRSYWGKTTAFTFYRVVHTIDIEDRIAHIGNWTFYNFIALKTVYLHENTQLSSIGEYAFKDCTSLRDVYLYADAEDMDIAPTAFDGCSDVTIHVKPDQLAAYQAKFPNLANVTFAGDLTPDVEPTVPELVSSEGNDLIAKTYTDLELQNAPGEGYEYKFIVYNETTNQWYKLQDFSDATTFRWYTGPAGVKNLYVDIRNKSDETDVKRVELTGVNVTDSGLAATLAIEPTGELAAKTQATLTATAENGTAPYEYKFIVFNATTNQWYKLKDFGPESTFDWYTGPAGTKTLYVDVKDANGVVVRQPLENIVVK